jgi:hypothetical protein
MWNKLRIFHDYIPALLLLIGVKRSIRGLRPRDGGKGDGLKQVSWEVALFDKAPELGNMLDISHHSRCETRAGAFRNL